MQRESRIGLELALPQCDLRRFAVILERHVHQGLDVVGIRRVPFERERKPRGRVHGPEHAVHEETVSLGRLHLDAVRLAGERAPVGARDREARRAPPPRESVRVSEGCERDGSRRRQNARHLEDELVHRLIFVHLLAAQFCAGPAASGCPTEPRYLMTAIVSPVEIAAPSVTPSSSTVPAPGAVISFSIFIASITQIRAPASTVAPCSTATFSTVPWSGDSSWPGAPPPPPPDLRSRRGAAFAAGDAPLGAAASPITFTSNLRPETSTA